MNKTRNAFSVDVEEYFQVEAFSDVIARESWGEFSPRAETQTRRTLELLETHGVRGTNSSWVDGGVEPSLVMEIHEAGHEIASPGSRTKDHPHGPGGIREDVAGRRGLGEITQAEVLGTGPHIFHRRGHFLGIRISSKKIPLQQQRLSHPPRTVRVARIRGGIPAGWLRRER
jgi:hypothetical protein